MNIALIGLGMVAPIHVAAIHGAGARLHGVMSRDPARAALFVRDECGVIENDIRVYETIDQIANDPNVDAVALCTPPNARLEIVQTLAAAGKHILMEKPIERSLSAARDIVEICEAAGVKLGIFFQYRMRATGIDLKSRLDSGDYGAVRVVEIAMPWWRPQSYYDEPGRGTYARDGGGVLMVQAIHSLDQVLSILGPITRVQAMLRTSGMHQMQAEDFVAAGLEFASGAIGSLHASTASFPGSSGSITVHCDLASFRLEPRQLEISHFDGRVETIGAASLSGGGADPMSFSHEWHQGIVTDFMAALEQDRAPVASGREALNVHALIAALTQSSSLGAAVDVRDL